ncbi:MAG: hypothetical protein PSX79_08570 [bacterium]|nr:hypothetical protein [Alphaproteobacteria bacterium]MDI1364903.1 hypothetical protein [bacterium]
MAQSRPDPFAILSKRVQAWESCPRIPGCDKAMWRQDADGRVIRWADFGDRFSHYGWEMRMRPSTGLLGRTFHRQTVEAIHWRGVLGGDARDVFDLPRAA